MTRFERLSFAFTEVYRCWHKIAADEMGQYGLKGPYAIYLIAMLRFPEGVTAARLCEICNRNKADVSRAVADMEKKGFLIKKGVPYRALLVLTEAGKTAAEQVSEKACRALEIGGKGLSDERRVIFLKTFEVIAANLKVISKEGLS